jgi:hypothetical protein
LGENAVGGEKPDVVAVLRDRKADDVAQVSKIFALVAAGEIVHFASKLFLTYPGVVYRPITDMPPIESALTWLAGEETAAIRAFADAARETLGKGVSRVEPQDPTAFTRGAKEL